MLEIALVKFKLVLLLGETPFVNKLFCFEISVCLLCAFLIFGVESGARFKSIRIGFFKSDMVVESKKSRVALR